VVEPLDSLQPAGGWHPPPANTGRHQEDYEAHGTHPIGLVVMVPNRPRLSS
jgi:hypothetical protein